MIPPTKKKIKKTIDEARDKIYQAIGEAFFFTNTGEFRDEMKRSIYVLKCAEDLLDNMELEDPQPATTPIVTGKQKASPMA